jgi:hypothetical protein
MADVIQPRSGRCFAMDPMVIAVALICQLVLALHA